MDPWRLVITGCGTSHGSPPWGWPQWWSDDLRDHRRRSGALVLGPAGQVVLIDAGPDLMHQLRDPYRSWSGQGYPQDCITRADGVLITHAHADHSHGLNDLRHMHRLMGELCLPVYGHAGDLQELIRMFPYCFAQGSDPHNPYQPFLSAVTVADGQQVEVASGLQAVPLRLDHGLGGRSTGWRLGGLAYCTDEKDIPPGSLAQLAGVEVLVLGMLRDQPHPSHACWEEVRQLIAQVAPRRTILVHMGFEVQYADWEGRLPDGVVLACDGMVVPFDPGTGPDGNAP